ncbi:MAG: riboflavin synthase [Chitinophagaceae bacterium]
MFTGIIETVGTITKVIKQGTNITFWISSSLSAGLKVDQSLSHNGVCLTIEAINADSHRVTAVEETISKTNLNGWKNNDVINLERCLPMNGRLDGHIVQGHVDAIGVLVEKKHLQGSWKLTFSYPEAFRALVIEKGSISINGISLTLFDVIDHFFSVAIIPYTYTNTNLQFLEVNDTVTIEYDMIGKYINRYLAVRN